MQRRPVVVGHPEQHAQPVADAADHLVVDSDAGPGDALDDGSHPPPCAPQEDATGPGAVAASLLLVETSPAKAAVRVVDEACGSTSCPSA